MQNRSLRADDWAAEALRKYSDMVYRLAYAQVRNRTDADDIFQEVFIRLVKSSPEFESDEHMKAWLIRVTVNCSKTMWLSSWKKRMVFWEDKDLNRIPAEEAPAAETPAQTLVIRVTGPEGLSAAGGACRVDMTQVSAVTLEWTCSAEHDGFAVTVTGPDGGQTYNAVQAEASLTLSVKGMQPGTYAVSVAAMLGETAVAEAKLNIELAQGEGMPEGGIPGGKPGGGSKGGGSRSGGSEQTAEAAMQGFSVTAGKALTSSHDPGDKSMRLYGSVELSAEEEAMTRLTLGGEALDVTLDGGAGTFTAALDGDALTLTPQADGEQWTLNGFALKTLARSGVNTVNLSLNGKIVAVATQPELSGRVYDGLCAAGFVSADYAYNVSAGGIRVSVNGEDYCLTEAGELAEDETISTEVK